MIAPDGRGGKVGVGVRVGVEVGAGVFVGVLVGVGVGVDVEVAVDVGMKVDVAVDVATRSIDWKLPNTMVEPKANKTPTMRMIESHSRKVIDRDCVVIFSKLQIKSKELKVMSKVFQVSGFKLNGLICNLRLET